jgi:hypothetical protein
MRVMFGKHPASPAPNNVRVTSSEGKLHTQPVAAVKNDHQTTIRVSTRRGPKRSASQPPGISKRAYAQPNTENAHAICTLLRPRSLEMSGAACEMHTRSMYMITAIDRASATVV